MNKEIYFTDDHALAAFLCMRGYTLLGAVDDGTTGSYGNNRLKFALTHTDLRDSPEAMVEDILNKTNEFSTNFSLPFDPAYRRVSFREYNIKLRMCKKALAFPVKTDALEQN